MNGDMNYNKILSNGWIKSGVLQYIKESENLIYTVVEGRFLEYSNDDLGHSVPVWCICENVIDLSLYINETGTYTKECSELLKHTYGQEDELKRIFPNKDERYTHLAALISRNIPNRKCIVVNNIKSSLTDTDQFVFNYVSKHYMDKNEEQLVIYD